MNPSDSSASSSMAPEPKQKLDLYRRIPRGPRAGRRRERGEPHPPREKRRQRDRTRKGTRHTQRRPDRPAPLQARGTAVPHAGSSAAGRATGTYLTDGDFSGSPPSLPLPVGSSHGLETTNSELFFLVPSLSFQLWFFFPSCLFPLL